MCIPTPVEVGHGLFCRFDNDLDIADLLNNYGSFSTKNHGPTV